VHKCIEIKYVVEKVIKELLGSYERVKGYSFIFKTYYINAIGAKGVLKKLLESYK
jgi:hypothetical protein